MAEYLSKRLYVEDESWKTHLTEKRFSDRKLEVRIVKRGIILPARRLENDKGWEGGVCDNDFNFVAGFSRSDGIQQINPHLSVISSYTVDRKKIVALDEDVIFGGVLHGHFGHFIMECWNRLWYVLQHPELKSKILFIQSAQGGYHSYFNEFFNLMGLDEERIIYVKKPTQCRSVAVPDQSQYCWLNFTKEFLLPYQAIKSKINSNWKGNSPKKLYLTRTGSEDLSDQKSWDSNYFNEKYFEDFFATRGFEIVRMDSLSIAEQIFLVMNADEIAAITGTLTNWAIFCKPSVKFIMLNRIPKMTVYFQGLVNEAANLSKCYFVDVSKNFMLAKHSNGVCMLGANKYWKAFVADYFGEQIEADDDNPYLEEALNNYVNFWYQKYATSKEIVIDSLKDMCNRIVALEAQTNRDRPLMTYQTHVAKKGWGVWKVENQLSNALDQNLDIQAIRINFTEPFHKIFYSVYCNEKEGWSQEFSAGDMAGTTGQKKSITGIKIRLDEAGAKNFDVLYRVHTFDGNWTAWSKNGEELLSDGVKLNALQVKLEKKINRPMLTYQTHIAKKGWGVWKVENQLSNALDQNLDIQAIRINFTEPFHKIFYSVYCNKKEGWSQEFSAGDMAGTTGQKKSITGIKIRLDEAGAKNFDVLYRVHTFDGDWTAWSKNGEELLSDGVKLNAIQIKLADKV